MASPTRDEHLVLQLLVSGKGSEEIAAALDLPPQVVRAYTYALITKVLDANTKHVRPDPHPLPSKEASA